MSCSTKETWKRSHQFRLKVKPVYSFLPHNFYEDFEKNDIEKKTDNKTPRFQSYVLGIYTNIKSMTNVLLEN